MDREKPISCLVDLLEEENGFHYESVEFRLQRSVDEFLNLSTLSFFKSQKIVFV